MNKFAIKYIISNGGYVIKYYDVEPEYPHDQVIEVGLEHVREAMNDGLLYNDNVFISALHVISGEVLLDFKPNE